MDVTTFRFGWKKLRTVCVKYVFSTL
jgi:hypothetical protein